MECRHLMASFGFDGYVLFQKFHVSRVYWHHVGILSRCFFRGFLSGRPSRILKRHCMLFCRMLSYSWRENEGGKFDGNVWIIELDSFWMPLISKGKILKKVYRVFTWSIDKTVEKNKGRLIWGLKKAVFAIHVFINKVITMLPIVINQFSKDWIQFVFFSELDSLDLWKLII